MTNEIQVYVFENNDIRTIIGNDGEPRFVAVDVCKALDLTQVSQAVGRLDDDEKGSYIITTPGGPQQVLVITEPGLYSLIITSRKPEAKAFKRWIYHEVIPQIRKPANMIRLLLNPKLLRKSCLNIPNKQ